MSTWPTSKNGLLCSEHLRRVTAVTNMNAGSSRSHAVRTLWFKWLRLLYCFCSCANSLKKSDFLQVFTIRAQRLTGQQGRLNIFRILFASLHRHFGASPVFPLSCECSPDQGPSQLRTERMIERWLGYHERCQIGFEIASWII